MPVSFYRAFLKASSNPTTWAWHHTVCACLKEILALRMREATDCLPSRTKSPSSGGESIPLRHTVACESTARTRSAHLFAGSYTIISLMLSLSQYVTFLVIDLFGVFSSHCW